MGKPIGVGSTLGAASLQARIDWVGTAVAFADATVELDGNSAVGAFTLDYGRGRPRIEGTLAAVRLDVSPYMEALHANVAGDPAMLLAAAALPPLPLDADIRISADQVLAGPARIGKTAGGFAIKNGAISISIGEAEFYGGTFAAETSIGRFGDRLVWRLGARLTDVASGPALADLAGLRALDGSASGQIDVAGQGGSWAELFQGLKGRGSFNLRDGTVVGLDMADLAALGEASPEPLVPGLGILRFSRLEGTATLDGGIVETNDAQLTGNPYRIDLKGWGSLATGLVDAHATLSAPRDGKTQQAVPIAIRGTWRHPEFDLDRGRAPPAAVAVPRG
jgi:AsmA protein